MRIHFSSLSRVNRAAKALAADAAITLSRAQEAVAYMCGYRNFRDLQEVRAARREQPSPDDEDLAPAERELRRRYQSERLAAFLKITPAEARRLVDAAAPGARLRGGGEVGPASRGEPLSMPMPGTGFRPDLVGIFALLPELRTLRVEFDQSEDSLLSHVATRVVATFSNGTSLDLPGVYFWRFLQMVPRELADENGRYRQQNPFCKGTLERLMDRLRAAYRMSVVRLEPTELFKGPPEFTVIDIAGGAVEVQWPAQLGEQTRRAAAIPLEKTADQLAQRLQPIADGIALRALREGYMDLKAEDRGDGTIGMRYVAKSWGEKSRLTFKHVSEQFSHEHRHASGHGGNKLYAQLLGEALDQYVDELAHAACAELERAGCLAAVATDLGIKQPTPTRVARGMLATKERDWCARALASAVHALQDSHMLSEYPRARDVAAPAPERPSGATRVVHARGKLTRESVQIEDPRQYPSHRSRSVLVRLGATALRDDADFQELAGRIEELLYDRRMDRLEQALAECRTPEEYEGLESVAGYCASRFQPVLQRTEQVIFGATMTVHADQYQAESVAITGSLDIQALGRKMDDLGYFDQAEEAGLMALLVDPKQLRSASWQKRADLRQQLAIGIGFQGGIELKDEPLRPVADATPQVRLLIGLMTIRPGQLPSGRLSEAVGEALSGEAWRMLGRKPALKVVVSPPHYLSQVLRGSLDAENMATLSAFIGRELRLANWQVYARTGHADGDAYIEFVSKTATARWIVPRSLPWAHVQGDIRRFLEHSPWCYLRAQFGLPPGPDHPRAAKAEAVR